MCCAECGCSCQLTPSDCSPLQDYRPDQCTCQCRDLLAKEACLDAGRVWAESTCSCGCPNRDQGCAAGLRFDEDSCACVVAAPVTSLEDVRSTRSHNNGTGGWLEDFPSLEHILIIILASIILVLLVVLLCLAAKIRQLSRRIRLHGGRDGGSPNPLRDSDLEVKQLEPGHPAVYGEAGSCSTPSSGFYSEIAANERLYGTAAKADSLYQSAESVRLKKQRTDSKPVVNIIDNILVEEEQYIRLANINSLPRDGNL